MNNKIYYLSKKDFPVPDIDNLINSKDPKNIGLWLQRFPLWYKDERKNIYKTDLKKQIKSISTGKLAIPLKIFPLQDYKNYVDRFEAIIKSMESQGFVTYFLDEYVSWRLVVGIGTESVYENSITFHRNYSVPIVPGSAVKGITNHYAIMLKKDEKLIDEKFTKIFGDQNKKGDVIFFDALPIIESNNEFLVLDITNVHYPDYYQKTDPSIPGDWMNPHPIFFLAVERLKYKFTVASKEEKLAEESHDLLKKAIEEIGVGAKTSAGYGRFKPPK